MPTLITQATIRRALADHRAGKLADTTDSKVDGLQIRARPSYCRYRVRGTLHGKQRSYDLGDVVEGDAALAEVRSRATKVREMLRAGMNPDAQVAAWLSGVSLDNQLKLFAAAPPAERPSWTWEAAKAAFLQHLEDGRRPATLRDYKQKLGTPELNIFAGRKVAGITRNELLGAVDAIHERGVEAVAKGVLRTVSSMWTWLADSRRQEQTGVEPNLLLKAKPPDSNKAELGDPNAPAIMNEAEGAPPELMLGRALVISRLGLLNEQASLGVQLLLATAQRRRTITEAGRFHFKDLDDGAMMWLIPPYFRKSGSKRGKKYHLVPVESFGADAVRKLDVMSDVEGSKGWLMPRLGEPETQVDVNILNHALADMGVGFAPHGVRYALATYGERDLGYGKSEAKVILDHLEGVEQSDVTGSFYNSDPGVKRKREMLQAWCSWLEMWAARALDADPMLLDRAYMMQDIYVRRNGEAKLERRIAYRAAREMPLWGPKEIISDAEATDSQTQEAAE
jgi:integrase